MPGWVLKLLSIYPTAANLAKAKVDRLVKIKSITKEKATRLIDSAKNSVASRSGETEGYLIKILFKKVCKAQKFTIFELTNLKSIYYELYTTASKRNFRSDSLRREWLSTNSQVFIGSHNAF
jgi:hypothetical protein